MRVVLRMALSVNHCGGGACSGGLACRTQPEPQDVHKIQKVFGEHQNIVQLEYSAGRKDPVTPTMPT